VERILIIGGGGTGGALAHDLTLRGFHVTLVEKGSLLSGTSGRHHGLLHSGARYALHDVDTARECYRENQILRRLAPQAIEANDGLFVAINTADMDRQQAFIDRCSAAGIPTRRLEREAALALEPALAPGILGAVQVPDATMDAWRLPLHFFATAHGNGARILPFHRVEALDLSNHQVVGALVCNLQTGNTERVAADLVVNAAGPWTGRIAAMAGIETAVKPGPGVMVSIEGRLTNMVINRLHPAGEGDICLPQRNLTILGTTAWIAEDPDTVQLPAGHVERLQTLCARLLPGVANAPVHAVWWASRPLLNLAGEEDPMRMSRGFACIDHQLNDNLEGFISLVGGKATTLRAMAQEAADLVCAKTGRKIPCATAISPLRPYRQLLQTLRLGS
jgi:glycerol-3-phosphate dehydrogenase